MELIESRLYIMQVILVFSWFITHFEPLTMYLLQFYSKYTIVNKFIQVVTCWKCLTLWVGVVLSLFGLIHIIDSITLSMIAYLLDKK